MHYLYIIYNSTMRSLKMTPSDSELTSQFGTWKRLPTKAQTNAGEFQEAILELPWYGPSYDFWS